MSVDKVREYLRSYGLEDRVMEFGISTATVAEAAEAVGVIPARIAKTLSFQSEECGCILVLMAGDAKVDNKKIPRPVRRKAPTCSPMRTRCSTPAMRLAAYAPSQCRTASPYILTSP